MIEADIASPATAPEAPDPSDDSFVDRAIELLLQPERFFGSLRRKREELTSLGLDASTTDMHLVVIIWIVGIAITIDRVDRTLLREQLSLGAPSGGASLAWPTLWAMFLTIGVLSGLFNWYVSGWWFRVRLRWSRAEDPDPHLARTVYMWSSLIWAVPTVLWTLVTTFTYPDYRTAYFADDPVPWFYIGSFGWSIFVAHRGAITAFDVDPKRARIWFAILPAVFFGAALIGGGFLAIA